MWSAWSAQLAFLDSNNIEAAAIYKIAFHRCANGLAGRCYLDDVEYFQNPWLSGR